MRIQTSMLQAKLNNFHTRTAVTLSSLLVFLGAVTAPPIAAIDSTPIYLSFAGDVHFEEQLKSQAQSGGLQSLKPIFADSDIVMINLETALTNRGKAENKTYTFRADPTALKTLKSVGVDVVTMANNHAMDYGTGVGLQDTLRSKAQSDVAVLGIGSNQANAMKPFVTTIKNTTFAYFAFDDFWVLKNWPATATKPGMAVWANHRDALIKQIKTWSAKVDVVAVYVHWGYEYQKCPTSRQRGIASQLADAGADIILGSHPHILQGIGKKSGSVVAYSLGNFAWYGHENVESGILRVVVQNKKVKSYSLIPTMYGKSGLPYLVTGTNAERVKNWMKQANSCDDLS